MGSGSGIRARTTCASCPSTDRTARALPAAIDHYVDRMSGMRRRQFLGGGLAGVAAIALGPAFWREALAARTRASASTYGPLGPPDALGLRLPPGFTAREIARANQPVAGSGYAWHIFSDGQ